MNSIFLASTYKQIARRSDHNSAVTSASACGAYCTESNAWTWLTASEICMRCVTRRCKSWTPQLTALSAHSRHSQMKHKSAKKDMNTCHEQTKVSFARKAEHYGDRETTTRRKVRGFISVMRAQANKQISLDDHKLAVNVSECFASDLIARPTT